MFTVVRKEIFLESFEMFKVGSLCGEQKKSVKISEFQNFSGNQRLPKIQFCSLPVVIKM